MRLAASHQQLVKQAWSACCLGCALAGLSVVCPFIYCVVADASPRRAQVHHERIARVAGPDGLIAEYRWVVGGSPADKESASKTVSAVCEKSRTIYCSYDVASYDYRHIGFPLVVVTFRQLAERLALNDAATPLMSPPTLIFTRVSRPGLVCNVAIWSGLAGLGLAARGRLRLAVAARRRKVTHTCPGCGYDLRGTTGNRCSECGRMIDPSQRAVPEVDRLCDNSCVQCGYSLEGNVSGVCPECGSPAPPRNLRFDGSIAHPDRL